MPYTLLTYDANGRLMSRERQFDRGRHRDFTFLWDGDDNLRQVKNGNDSWLTATYNGDNLRVTKHDFFTPDHNYSWGLGSILHDSSNNTLTTPGVSQNVGGTDQFFHTDWLGSTRDLTDSTGNTLLDWQHYDAFGQRTWQAGPNFPSEFLFAGDWGYQNEYNSPSEPGVGLQYLENRYYDPAVGRFISPDPISFDGGLNLYGYASNDPVNIADPDGLGGFWFGKYHLGDDHPWLAFEAAGTSRGLRTGLAAVGTAFTYGHYNGGCYRNEPGFGTSVQLGIVGREALIQALNAKVTALASKWLSGARLPRLFQRVRPGRIRLPGGAGVPTAPGPWMTVRESLQAARDADSLSPQAGRSYFNLMEKLAKGDLRGLNAHALRGARAGQWAADLAGLGRGRGGGRVIFQVSPEGVVDILEIVTGHRY